MLILKSKKSVYSYDSNTTLSTPIITTVSMKNVRYFLITILGIVIIIMYKIFRENEVSEITVESAFEVKQLTVVDIPENISEQTWFTNTQFGLAFETPKRIMETNVALPSGTNEYVSKLYTYSMNDSVFAVNYMVMETNFNQYDAEKGLRGAVTNLINTVKGNRLTLGFFDNESGDNSKGCNGSFLYQNSRMQIQGYCLYKDSGRVYIIVAAGPQNENTESKMDRVFESIIVLDL